jgi:ATP/maltotriose-dependent transcriptional regulator MalT
LGNINRELCDAALGRRDSQSAIEELAAQELVAPLLGKPGWFQHHPLLAETLRDRDHHAERHLSRAIHRRAARWHADRQDRHRAVTHLLALGDFSAAAEIVLGGPPVQPVDDLTGLLAAAGRAQTSRSTSPERASTLPILSPRESQVLERLAAGLANKEIARDLYVSMHTVKSHIHHIFRKLQVNNRTAAVGEGRRHGFVR